MIDMQINQHEGLLTIFTPTYNRSKLLQNLYNSLLNQTDKCFEWIIVDDGSNDNTEEIIFKLMENNNEFSIRYYKQQHGGKHRAINFALKYAKGDYFFIVDSDDYIINKAVQLIHEWIAEIGENESIAGVAGLRISGEGRIWGNSDIEKNKGRTYIEATNLEREKYELEGDKAEVYKTDILRKYPFPEFEGEYFVTEDVCWDAIAADGYKIRWYKIPIYVCDYLEDGLTQKGANGFEGHKDNYQGYCYYIKQCLRVKNECTKNWSFREFNNMGRKLHKSFYDRASDIGMTRYEYFLQIIKMYVFCSISKIKRGVKKRVK